MDKIKELIEELRNLNTNDPVMQRKIVKVLDQLVVVLQSGVIHTDKIPGQHFSGCGCVNK